MNVCSSLSVSPLCPGRLTCVVWVNLPSRHTVLVLVHLSDT